MERLMQGVNANPTNSNSTYTSAVEKPVTAVLPNSGGNTLPAGSTDSVTISPQAKALLESDETLPEKKASNKGEDKLSKSVTSFAHGALGMDHPDDLEKQEDSSYSAGQYASAAVTIGALILALV
ncbi:hypothetical protein [Vibrio hangzhouensis]|nr:hypothetical protein [Vibrio hangzhouensis]